MTTSPTPPRRILIVEGSPQLRFILRARLEKRGWQVTAPETPQAAREFLRSGRFDRVYVNCYPRSMEGMAILAELPKSPNAGADTVVFAGPAQSELAEARRLGATWVLELTDFRRRDDFIDAVAQDAPKQGR